MPNKRKYPGVGPVTITKPDGSRTVEQPYTMDELRTIIGKQTRRKNKKLVEDHNAQSN